MKQSLLLQAVYETPWAILPTKLALILEVAHRHARGEELPAELRLKITAAPQAAAEAAAARAGAASRGAVAVLPILGTIIPRGDMMLESSGAVSATRIAAQFRAALQDSTVGAIVLDIDSPGGSAMGIDELASEIFQARGQKPVVAVANHMAASAAYWLASAADELVVSPSGEVGSIGVFSAHADYSKALELEGVAVNLIAAGKFKTEANPYQPLSEEARAFIQSRVDDLYATFTKTVARNRGASVADVRAGFGEGRMVGAKEAVAQGMADRVGTLDDTIARLVRGQGKAGPSAAADFEMRQRRLRLAATHHE